MKRLARSTGEQRQNCFPTLLFLPGGGRKKKSTHQICDKTSFHGLGGDQPDMACWHTCVSNPPLGIYGKTLEKVSTHSEMRAANFAHDMCVKSKYESDDKSRDVKEWNASEGWRGEKKKEKKQT